MTGISNTTPLSTNFNNAPYWDDYNPEKNFHRILYKPSLSVQGRELIQQQTILQDQITRLGAHLFQDGTLVNGGQFNLDLKLGYVKLRNKDAQNISINLSNFANTIVTGASSGVKAYVLTTATGTELSSNTNTLFVKYTQSGATANTFTLGEKLTSTTSATANVISSVGATGLGSMFTIEPGIVFGKGHLVRFDRQSIILDRYGTTPSYKVGFVINESIVTPNDDATLNSLAQGTTNYAAPGADRLKLTAVLSKYPLTANTGTDFVQLFEIKSGIVQQNFSRTQYAVIADELAKRTFDQSGNYYVQGMDVNLRNNLDTGTNLGLLTLSNGGNTSLLSVGVEPGTAYIKGYEINKLVTSYVNIDKGISFKDLTGQVISGTLGSYVYIKEAVGLADINTGAQVKLYDTAQTRISGRKWSTGSQTGSQIGTARVRAVVYDTGTMGTATCQYLLYLYDIEMTSGAFTAVRSIYYDNAGADFGADVVLTSGQAVLQESGLRSLVYPLSTAFVRRIRDSSGNIETNFAFEKRFDVSIGTGGTFTLTSGAADEIFPYTVGALDATEKRQLLVSLNASANVALSGTATTVSGNNTVTGSGTSFNTRLNVGDKLQFNGVTGVYFVTALTSSAAIQVSPAPTGSVSGATYSKIYEPGDIIDFTLVGSTAGAARTVTAGSSTSLSFAMQETLSAVTSASVIAQLHKTTAREIKKTIRKNRYVLLDCSSGGGTTGPWDLGVSDVFQINSIRKSASFATTSDGTDVTSFFTLDDGQRDAMYDMARILNTGGLSLSSGDKLLVCFDYFYHDYSQGVGYFSVDSYPIDDTHGYANTSAIATEQIPLFTSPLTGLVYDLRNSIDTRPSILQTANDVTSLTGISTNPSYPTTLEQPAGCLHQLAPDSTFTMDYSFYLPRKDIVLLHSNGDVSVTSGVPDTVPITPATPDDSMSLATIYVAPYPSLTQTVAANIGRLDLACSITKTAYKRYTMRDIGVLKQRIDNVERYTSLSLLEKNTLDMKIPDTNGLDRFKNGIFVDPFQNLSLGDLNNPDFRIACDPTEQSIRPIFDTNAAKLKYSSGSGVINANNLIMLNYTEAVFAQQPYASDTRNLAGVYYNYKGFIELTPNTDYWIDTTTVPAIQSNFGQNANWQSLADAFGTQWNDWQTTWTGVTVTQGDPGLLFNQSLGIFGNPNQGSAITTITTTTQNQTRDGQKLNVSTDSFSQSLGNKVIDVSLIPYIRPQIIQVKIYGLKPSTTHFVFFDGEAMSSYSTPANSSFTPTSTEGSAIVTDTQGTAYFLLRLPASGKQFRVGNKTVRVTDSITNSNVSVTSAADTTFNALGLNQTKQDTILTTTTPIFTTEELTQTRTIASSTSSTSYFPRAPGGDGGDGGGGDPLAQSFQVGLPTNIPGIFLTSVDLFFQAKDPTLGVIVEIRVGDNSGNVSRTLLPYSQSYIPSSAINTSQDGTVATKIYFKSPVYVSNSQEYEIVVKPEGNNPNTVLWTAVLGNTDIASGVRIVTQPFSGVFFISSNNSTWSAMQNEDMKFTLYRASFSVGSGTVTTVNDSIENMTLSAVSSDFEFIGETINGETRLTFSSVAGGSVANTYIVTGGTSHANGQINFVAGSTYHLKNVPIGKSFTIGESVSFKYANAAPTGVTAVVASQSVPTGKLFAFKSTSSSNSNMKMAGTTSTFRIGEQLRGQQSNAYATIGALNNYKYSTIDLEAASIIVNGTAVDWTYSGTSNTYTVDSSATAITANHNKYFTVEKMLVSNSNEAANMGGAKSIVAVATLTTALEYVSPVIDLNKTYTILVHNIINNDVTNETAKSGGHAIDRYISEKVTLADGQDAEDLNVYITAYKPSGSQIHVYAKYLNGEDSDLFDDRAWVEMTLNSADAYGSTDNVLDFKDYDYVLPTTVLTGGSGQVQYTNSNSVTFTGYKYFAIKIVLVSSDSAVVPRVTDLRAIALQI